MRHLQILSKPPLDWTIPCSTVPTSLWHGLTPAQRQQLAQGLAELIERMRQRSPSASTESNHEQL